MPQEYRRSMTSNLINLSITRRERPINLLDYIDYICITWFTFDFTIRCFVAPNKFKFFKSITNWIDLFANMWFYLDLVYNYFISKYDYDRHPAWDLAGTIRVMRLFKLFNHYAGLTIIIASLRASAGILRLLVFFIGVAIIIFASLIYYSEKLAAGSDGRNGMSSLVGVGHQHGNTFGNENQFNSIIEAIWFSIASLTTVGFGDYLPKTPFGMIFGAMCTVAGVLMIDLPMPIIVENFANYYKHLQASSKFPKKLRRQILPVETNRFRKQASSTNQVSLSVGGTSSMVQHNAQPIPKSLIVSTRLENTNQTKSNVIDPTLMPLLNDSKLSNPNKLL